jgi:hypothetical protein
LDNFFSNYEPLRHKDAQAMLEDAILFHEFTEPMRALISDFAASGKPDYLVSSAHPRLVDGKPSKNPRYLQKRPDLMRPVETYVAETGTRLRRRMPAHSFAA